MIQSSYQQITISSQFITLTNQDTLFMNKEYQELLNDQTKQWENHQLNIKQLEELISISSGSVETILSNKIQKQGIRIQTTPGITQISFSKQKGGSNRKEIQFQYETKYGNIIKGLNQQLSKLKQSILIQQNQIRILTSEIQTKRYQTQKLSIENQLNNQKYKKQLLRYQNENRLLIEQTNRLKLQLNSSNKLNKSLNESNKSQKQKLTHSSVQTDVQKVLQNQKDKQQNSMDETIGEQNIYLRNMIAQLNQQIERLMKENKSLIKQSQSNSKSISSISSYNSQHNLSPQAINYRNKISELQSSIKIMTHKISYFQKQQIVKQSQIKSMSNQIKTLKNQSPIKKTTFKFNQDHEQKTGRNKTQESSLNGRYDETMTKIINQLRTQNRQLLIKLDQQRKDRISIIQKHQIEYSKLKSIYETNNKQLKNSKSNKALNNLFHKEQYQIKIKQLQSKISKLNSQKNTSNISSNNRYVASSSYEYLKQSTQKQRKAFNQIKDKLKSEINELKLQNNKLIQTNNSTKNQKLRTESQLNRGLLQVNKMKQQHLKIKKQNEALVKRLRLQQNQINAFKVSRSYESSPRNTDRQNYQLNEQVRILRDENERMKEAILQYKSLLNNRNLTAMNSKLHFYQNQIKQKNSNIKVLISDLRDRDDKIDILQNQLYRMRSHKSNNSPTSLNGSLDQSNYYTQLDYSNKMIQKLSENVKVLKIQKYNLQKQLNDNNKTINVLNIRITQLLKNKNINPKVQYNDLHTFSKDNRNQNDDNMSGSFVSMSGDIDELKQQVEFYKNKYQQALETGNYLQQCLYQARKTLSPNVCGLCTEYQIITAQLQRRINIYEVLVMGELRKLFMTCETKLGETNYTWHQLENIIFDLRSRKLNQRPVSQSYSASSYTTRKIVQESPISARITIERSPKSAIRTQRRLDDLIKSVTLNYYTIFVLMLRIADGVSERKTLKFILPDCIYILYLDFNNIQRMKVQFMENKQLIGQVHKIYLAPEVLSGGQHTQKSLIWNLGVIFNLIINKKNYFLSQEEVLNKGNVYKFVNRQRPQFKYIIEAMLQRDINKRLGLEKVRAMLAKLIQEEMKQNMY